MSFSHWLKGATRVRFDDRTLGNVLKNGAVAGGTLAGGPLGLAIAAGGSALGQKALGGTWSDAAHAGLKGAATTGGLQAAKGLVSGALSGGASSASSAVPAGPGALPSAAGEVPNLTTSATSPGFFSKALHAGQSAAGFLGDHDQTAAAVFNGVGNALDHTDEDQRRAETDSIRRKNERDDYEFAQQKARDLAMEPLRQALYGSLGTQIGNNYAGIAANPYSHQGGG